MALLDVMTSDVGEGPGVKVGASVSVAVGLGVNVGVEVFVGIGVKVDVGGELVGVAVGTSTEAQLLAIKTNISNAILLIFISSS